MTEVERWVRDPYAIYARRVLRLDVLDPLDAEIGPLERGDAVHKALERFVTEHPGPLGDDAALKLIAIADQVFASEGTPKAALALWRPRFANAAFWFVEKERDLREARETSLTEIKGRWPVTPEFELRGVADRIDILHGGTGAIFDYKTGKPPTGKQIKAFLAPQLLLEAEMLRAGAFGDPREMIVVTGIFHIEGPQTRQVRRRLLFEQRDIAFQPRHRLGDQRDIDVLQRAGLAPTAEPDIDQRLRLARVREWSLGGWEAPEE